MYGHRNQKWIRQLTSRIGCGLFAVWMLLTSVGIKATSTPCCSGSASQDHCGCSLNQQQSGTCCCNTEKPACCQSKISKKVDTKDREDVSRIRSCSCNRNAPQGILINSDPRQLSDRFSIGQFCNVMRLSLLTDEDLACWLESLEPPPPKA